VHLRAESIEALMVTGAEMASRAPEPNFIGDGFSWAFAATVHRDWIGSLIGCWHPNEDRILNFMTADELLRWGAGVRELGLKVAAADKS